MGKADVNGPGARARFIPGPLKKQTCTEADLQKMADKCAGCSAKPGYLQREKCNRLRGIQFCFLSKTMMPHVSRPARPLSTHCRRPVFMFSRSASEIRSCKAAR